MLDSKKQAVVRQYLDGFADDSAIPPVRITVLGCMGVGKRSVIYRAIWNFVLHDPDPTEGPYEEGKTIVQNRHIMMQWDRLHLNAMPTSPNITGKDQLDMAIALTPGHDACLLLYEAEWRVTFERLRQFVAALDEHMLSDGTAREKMKPRLFVAMTKVDRDASLRKVSVEEGSCFSDQVGATFVQLSARESTGLSRAEVSGIVEEALYHRAAYSQVEECATCPTIQDDDLNAKENRLHDVVGGLFCGL